jgi:hypothetical protein
MRTRISKISLIIFAVMLVLGGFQLSVAGNYWQWFAAIVPFAVVPLILGPRWYRLGGGISLLLASALILGDIEAGARLRERRLRLMKASEIGEQNGAANGSQPFRSDTNQTPSAAGSRR